MAKDVTQTHSEHMFAIKLMQHLVVPTFVLGPDGRVIIWNKACERLTNVSAEEVLGTRNHWKAFYSEPRECLADLVASDDMESMASLYTNHCLQQDLYDGVRAENWCFMPRTEKKRYLAINAGPIYDDEGHLIAVVETLRDMTEQKNAEDALHKLAHRDGLTNLANRRSFDTTLAAMVLHCFREQVGLALILCDVDHFKAYNDTYGHQKGDQCLQKIAQTIQGKLCRPMDLAARYGGEEFALILPHSDCEGAQHVADEIQKAIYMEGIAHETSPTAGHITASMGIICMVPHSHSAPCDYIGAADKALYQAKAEGRNRICIAQPD